MGFQAYIIASKIMRSVSSPTIYSIVLLVVADLIWLSVQ